MDCLFCKIAQGVIETHFLAETKRVLAFADINPQAPTHILIIPKAHIKNINEIEAGDTIVSEMTEVAQKLARDIGCAEAGYRLVFNCNANGGQEVNHLHLHLLAGRQMTWPPG